VERRDHPILRFVDQAQATAHKWAARAATGDVVEDRRDQEQDQQHTTLLSIEDSCEVAPLW